MLEVVPLIRGVVHLDQARSQLPDMVVPLTGDIAPPSALTRSQTIAPTPIIADCRSFTRSREQLLLSPLHATVRA